MKEKIFNVVSPLTNCIKVVTPKKGQSTVRISKNMLNRIYKQAKNLNKLSSLIIKIPINDKEEFVLTCNLKKEKV